MRIFTGTAVLLLSSVFSVSAQTTITLGADTGTNLRPLLGVNGGPLPTGESKVDLTTRYQGAGVTQIRTHDNSGPFDMNTVYPNQNADPTRDSSYNWTSSDAYFRAILDGGFEPYLRIGTVNGTTGAVTNTSNWVQAAVALVRRYSDPARWGRNALRYIEICNEPDSRTFWTGTPEAFQQLYIAAARAIKAAFPSLKVGGPAFTGLQYSPLPGSQQGAMLRPFLAAVQSAGAPLDFLSWHTYTNTPAEMTAAAQYFRTQLNAYGFTSAESILSEWNTDFEGPKGGDAALRTGARGSSILAGTWISLQLSDVAATMLYRGPDPSLNLPTFYGMWYADGRPKPAALAQMLFSEMVRYPVRVAATSSSSDVSVLASRNAAGTRAVLLVNNTAQPVRWTLGGTTGTGNTSYRLEQIADDATAITTPGLSAPAGSIPGYGVQLVTIGPATPAGAAPVVSSVAGAGGSVPAVTTITSNGYFSVYGSRLAEAGTAREVRSTDLTGNTLPVNLAGTCVTVAGSRAFLSYVSPGQVNAIVPAATGSSASVSVVTNCGASGEQTSAPVTVSVAAAAPELLYFVRNVDGTNPVAAVNSITGAYVGPPNLIAGATFTPARAGDLVTLFGIGFGPLVTPETPGSLASVANAVQGGVSLTIGGRSATVSYAGAVPGYAGLYQVNLTMPAGLPAGNQAIAGRINGVDVAAGAVLAVQ